MTWRSLLGPDYTMTFFEAFLIVALPALGIASAVTNGGTGAISIHAWPSGPSLAGATLLGILNGLRAIRTLRTPPPA